MLAMYHYFLVNNFLFCQNILETVASSKQQLHIGRKSKCEVPATKSSEIPQLLPTGLNRLEE